MNILSVKYSEDRSGYSNHYHDAHEILYIVAGQIAVSISGIEYSAGAGSMLIFNRFEEHSVRVLTDDYCRYALLISSEISRSADIYLLTSVLVNRSHGFKRVIDCTESKQVIEELLSQMNDEFILKRPMFESALSSSFIRILIELYRADPELFTPKGNRNTEIVRELQELFESRYSESYRIDTLASDYHVSSSHLVHVFKQITGYSPIEYLMSCRLSAAKNMLTESDKSIKEIIDLCGYSDESNFSRMFKARVGVTPSEFRKHNSNKRVDK